MSEFTGGERPYKQSAVKQGKGKVSRAMVAGAIIGSSIIGTGVGEATGVLGKVAGKLGQLGKAGVERALEAEGELLDRNNKITQSQVDQIRQNMPQDMKDKIEDATTGRPSEQSAPLPTGKSK